MGLTRWVKRKVDKLVDAVTDTFKAIVDIVMSPFGIPDYGSGDMSAQQAQQDIVGPLLNKDSGVGDIPVIYGKRRVGGHRVFVSTNGTNNEYLYVALVLGEGPIDAFETLYIDDVAVPLTAYTHSTESTPSSGDYVNRITCQFFDGRDDQTVSTLLDAAPGWDSNHTLSGLAYLAVKFRWLKITDQASADNNPFRSGIPKINLIVRGRKIYDITASYTPTYAGTISATSGSGTGTYTASTASITGVTGPPTASYNSTITFATTSATAQIQSSAIASVVSRGVIGEWQAVTVRQLLTNTDTTAVVSDITHGPISTDTQTSVSATVAQDYAVPTANYTLVTYVTLTGNGPLTGIPTGTYNISAQVSTDDTFTHTTAYASEAVTYTNNPVNVLLDYMRNSRYGKGLANDVFEWNSIRLAAQQCDQTVPYTDITSGRLSEFDGLIVTSGTILNNIRSILASFRGILPYQSGQYYLKIPHGGDDADMDGTPANPPITFTITDDIIIGGLQIQGESKDRKINQMRVTYTDPLADYQPNDVLWPEEDSAVYAGYLTEDNMALHTQLTLGHCTHRERALNYAETMVKTSRNKMIVAVSTTMAAANVSVGDLIRIVNRHMNFDGIYRVESVSLSSEGSIGFQTTEHSADDYGLDGQAADRARPSINLPNPNLVTAPTLLTVQSGAAYNILTTSVGYLTADSTLVRLRVAWTASTDPYTTEYIVQSKVSSDSDWITNGITPASEFFIAPVLVGADYDVRVATRNELDRRSNFITVSTHTVSA